MNHKLLLLLAFIAVSSVGASGSKDGCYPKPFETVEFKPPKLPTEGVYFHEEFTNRSVLGTKWVPSDSRLKMHVSHGVSFGHPGRKFTGSYEIASQPKSLISGDYGLLFESSAFWVRLHAIAAKLDKPYHFKLEKPLIVQFEANFVVELSCSFFALKLLPGFEETPALFRWRKYLEDFDDESFFTIAFGPDYPCTEEGKGLTKETRVFVQVGTEHSWPFKHEVHKCVGPVCEEATLLNNTGNHLYTLRMEPDDTFYVYIDNELRTKGNLSEHFEPKIALYDHRFPPQTLSQIGHPKYKGPIPTRFNELRPITAIGLMTNDGARAGIAVDNIIVTDDEKIAREYAEQTYGAKLAQEKALAEPPLICPKKTEKVPVDDSKGAASALNGFRLKITWSESGWCNGRTGATHLLLVVQAKQVVPLFVLRVFKMAPLIDIVQILLYCLLALFTVVSLYVISVVHEKQRCRADKDAQDANFRACVLRRVKSVLQRLPESATSTERSRVAVH